MTDVLTILLFLTIGCLVWGVISPAHFGRKTKIKRPLTRKHTGLGFGTMVIILSVLISVSAPKTVTLNSTNAAERNQASSTVKPPATVKPTSVVTTEQVNQTQPISFTTTDENDSSLPKGQTHVKQAGQDGVETLTYNVTYSNGAQISKTLASQVTTTQPVDQIVEVGTYVASVTPPAPAVTSSPAPTPTTPSAPQPSCTPLSNEDTCYEPGEYCRAADHGVSGVAGDGKSITCENNNGWRWEPN